MRIHAFRGVGGGCARPPMRQRLRRAVQAPGTVHVMTQTVLPAYGRNDLQELRRLVACWLQEVVEEEEVVEVVVVVVMSAQQTTHLSLPTPTHTPTPTPTPTPSQASLATPSTTCSCPRLLLPTPTLSQGMRTMC
jgi:hypothetical protein